MRLKPRQFRKPRRGHWATKGNAGLWLFNEGSGNTVFDLSGNGNDGTFQGIAPSWTSGKFGSAIYLPGNNEHISVADNNTLDFGTGDFTVSIWINTSVGAWLFQKGSSGAGQTAFFRLYLRNTDPYVRISVATVGAAVIAQTTSQPLDIRDGQWHHVIGMRKGDDVQVYIDGILRATDAGADAIDIDNSLSLFMGAMNHDGNLLNFNEMTIDAPMIYNRALSAGEIAELYWNSFCMFERDPIELWVGATSVGIVPLSLSGSIAAQSSVEGNIDTTEALGGQIDTQSTLTVEATSIETLAGLTEGQSGAAGNLQWLQELAGLIEAQSAAAGYISAIETLSGWVGVQAVLTAKLKELSSLSGTIEAQSSVAGNIIIPGVFLSLGGLIAAQSNVPPALLNVTKQLSGVIPGVATVSGNIFTRETLAGLIAAQSVVIGNIIIVEAEGVLSGTISAHSGLTGALQLGYKNMLPAMHEALIDPYSGGAWLWLVEINIPGYGVIRLARNPIDVIHAGLTFLKNNFDIGLTPLSSDGSVSRTILKVAQDKDFTLEDKINATEGASGGTIRIIRVHEDFLDTFTLELEQSIRILTADSDTGHVIFQLGIPDPLLKKIPTRRTSSKICPWALPGLFRGIECQYDLDDVTCTGKYTDCLTKGNEVHFGAELGLDPSTSKV